MTDRYEFRSINKDEVYEAVSIEQICFPPNEACSEKDMKDRIERLPELFLVAVDKKTGKIAGFLNGLATDESLFRDEFFTDAGLHNPDGKNIMILGLDVLPQYRMQGLGRELVNRYVRRERKNGRRMVILTCLEEKVKMYEKMGFCDKGISGSSWGGEEWHEMSRYISYNFYGHDKVSAVKAVNNIYPGIETPLDLYDALSEIWCAETCAPRMRDEWTQENMTLGQCSVTAFLAQDIFGGKVYGMTTENGGIHCYNIVNGIIFDLTCEQFGEKAKELVYGSDPVQERESDYHFGKEEKFQRYEYLKRNLKQNTLINNSI